MAKLDLDGFDEIDKMFRELARAEDFAVEAVDAVAPILEEATRNAVRQAAKKGYATDGLARSFTKTPAKKNDLGVYSVVRPVGGRKGKGKDAEHDYAERAAWLEFGVYHQNLKWKQEASPFRQKAINDVKAECEALMEKKVYEAVDKAVDG